MDTTTLNYLFIKENVSLREYKIYKFLNNMNLPFIPKLYQYDKQTKILTMQRIIGSTVADFYGENFDEVSSKTIAQVRSIVNYLYNIGVVYPDVTGYNFIIDKIGKVWVIDFEHCFYINNCQHIDSSISNDDIRNKKGHIDYVSQFICCKINDWNEYFK